jgi:thiamine-phosphate pyrophosphorylase
MHMRCRQITPRQWLVIPDASDRDALAAAKSLPRGSGVLLVTKLIESDMQQLRRAARRRGLVLVVEMPGIAERVHNLRELSGAMLRRTPLILLSPLRPTSTHPGSRPIPRMRAAALAKLANRHLIALGGMNQARYATFEPLGFIAWAGISAFRT